MKIHHLTKSLHGGAGQYALRLHRALVSAGVQSRLLVMEDDGTPDAEVLKERTNSAARLTTRGMKSLSHRLSRVPYHSFYLRQRYERPEAIEPGDIVHLHSLTGVTGQRGVQDLLPPGVRVFWTLHDLWPLSGGCVVYAGCRNFREKCGNCPALKGGFKPWARAELAMKEDFVRHWRIRPVANSGWMAQRIRESRIFGGQAEIPAVPPIVDEAFFADYPELEVAQTARARGKKVIALGARAVTDKFKGIPDFLAALAAERELCERVVVLLFGEGKLDAPAGVEVIPAGKLSAPAQLAPIYRSSDVFVSPSRMETFGMALAEAQACGAPVAGYDVGGIREAVRPQDHDRLVPDGDMPSLLAAVRSALDAPSSGAHERREWVRARFSASAVAADQLSAYGERVVTGVTHA